MEVDKYGFPIPPKPLQPNNVWDCIDPCALVCFGIEKGTIPFDRQVATTLDAFGWLTPEGWPNYEMMRQQFARTIPHTEEKK